MNIENDEKLSLTDKIWLMDSYAYRKTKNRYVLIIPNILHFASFPIEISKYNLAPVRIICCNGTYSGW